MKIKHFSIIVLLFFSLNLNAQNFIIENCYNIDGKLTHNIVLIDTLPNNEVFHVSFYGVRIEKVDSTVNNLGFIVHEGTKISRNIDTLALIEELLKFKGDTRLTTLDVMQYNWHSCGFYTGKKDKVSVQVQALFIINTFLIPGRPFFYGGYPLLYDTKFTQKREDSKFLNSSLITLFLNITNSKTDVFYYPKITGVKGQTVEKAYDAYEEWFKVVKKNGMSEMRRQKFFPLTNSTVIWKN